MHLQSPTAAAVLAAAAALAASCVSPGGEDVSERTRAAPGADAPVAETKAAETPLETRVFQLAYIRAEQNVHPASPGPAEGRARGVATVRPLLELLEAMKSDRGTVAALKGTNALVATDTPDKLAAMEKLINEVDRPPKQVHLSVKLVMLSDADAATVSAKYLPNWRPAESPALGILKTFDFNELQAFFLFVRKETRGSITQLPQSIALDHEEATIDLEEAGRHAWAFVAVAGPGQAEPAQKSDLKLGEAGLLLVMPHVTGPENDVILTVVPGVPQPAAEFEVFDGGPLGALKLPRTNHPRILTKVLLRKDETALVACGRGEWRGEKVNVLVTVTPTVIDFEKGADIRETARRAREELGTGSPPEEEIVPETPKPDTM